MEKAIIAMSGGVDSSVAAYLIKKAGYEATGITMALVDSELLGNDEPTNDPILSSVEDARSIANKLGIDFAVCDLREEFRDQVVKRFIDAYECGATPNPCIECNRYIKFSALYRAASDILGGSADHYIATGHYAKIERDNGNGRFMLRKALDPAKDQSYVLYSLDQETLSKTLLPLGDFSKSEVRAIASEQGFINANKRESQDICFIPDGDYSAFIERQTGRIYPPGDFVDMEGNVLGTHKGLINYTIGQRKGLGLALKKPMYVCELDTVRNSVILGDNADLFKCELTARDFNWSSCPAPASDIRASARIRYKHKESPATVIPLAEDRVKVIFDEPQRAITRGQSVVLYDGDYVLGGGTIE